MFIVCNYLDIIRNEELPDGFRVEDCSVFDSSLEGYFVICREHRQGDILEWARINMGTFYSMFEKQFRINKQKAMRFIASNGKITSFTSEFVLACGGLEKFKETYGIVSEPLLVSKDSDVRREPLEETVDIAVEEKKQEASKMEQNENLQGGKNEGDTERDTYVEFAEVTEPEGHFEEQSDGAEKSEEKTLTEERTQQECTETNVGEPVRCDRACIYNPDGTFKGFSEGQVLSMLQHLRELDKEIALDTLNPDYILEDNEIGQASIYLETISPSVFKGFILNLLEQVHCEADYIRVSVILDKFSDYVTSLNRD